MVQGVPVSGREPAAVPSGPRNPPVLAALRVDARELSAVKGSQYRGVAAVLDVLSLPGFWAVVLWRIGNALHDRGNPLARLCYFANTVLFGTELAAGAVVAPGVVMPHPVGVGVASDVIIGARCRIMGLVRVGGSGRPDRPGHAVIGDDVWLMDGAKVFGPVRVGDRTLVGSGALLTRDVPADMMVIGPRGVQESDFRPRRPTDTPGGAAPEPELSPVGPAVAGDD